MSGRPHPRVYQSALAELRERYLDEFEAIYHDMLKEEGVEVVVRLDFNECKAEALEFIREYIEQHGEGPTGAQVGQAVGASREYGRRLIAALIEDGHLE